MYFRPHEDLSGYIVWDRPEPSDFDALAEADLGGRPTWDFQSQFYQPVSADLAPGDVVRTRCVWNNDGDTMVHFGETTEDEMCFSFTMYWPRVTAPQWTWGTVPLLTHCHPTAAGDAGGS